MGTKVISHSARRILVLSEMLFKPDRMRISGILRYAALHPNWEVTLYPDHPSNRKLPTKPAGFDGLITTGYFMRTVRDTHGLAAIRPAVIFDPTAPLKGRRVSVFAEDNLAIGKCAAEFLLRKGCIAFAFVGTPQKRHWSEERGKGFAQHLRRSHHAVSVYRGGDLADFLRKLPKPCGIFSAIDCCARDILNACHHLGIAVPEQVSVLGVDNEDFICETSRPTLSSIEADIEKAGYRSAEVLDAILNHATFPARATYGVKGVVERLSTTDLSGRSRIVAMAREFIRAHGITPITIQDMATACGVSLRLLQRCFASVLNDSPANFLRTHRLGRVCEMLTATDTPIDRIGELCGFTNPKHLKGVFKKVYGQTMRDYRKAAPFDHLAQTRTGAGRDMD